MQIEDYEPTAAPIDHTPRPRASQAVAAQKRAQSQADDEPLMTNRPPQHLIVGIAGVLTVIGVLALYLKDTYAVTEDTIGYFFPIFGIVGVVMRVWLVGWFNERFGEEFRRIEEN